MNIVITLFIRHIIPRLMPILFGLLKEKLYLLFEDDKDKRKNKTVERLKQKNTSLAETKSNEIPFEISNVMVDDTPPMSNELSDLEKAILELDPENEKHWAYYNSKRQRPDLDAVELFLDYRPSVKEVNDAWKNIINK